MIVKVGEAEPDVAERDGVAAVEDPSAAAAPSTPSGSALPRRGSSAAEPASAQPAAKTPAPPKPWADRASAASTAAPWEGVTAKGTEGITSTTEGVVDEPRVTEGDDPSADARDVEVPPATDVIDLTSSDQTSIDDLEEDEGDEDAGADAGSASGAGWASPNEKIWQLLRGRRRD
jgi:hypothetical protein